MNPDSHITPVSKSEPFIAVRGSFMGSHNSGKSRGIAVGIAARPRVRSSSPGRLDNNV
jgi:hypothetical protein